MVILKLLLIHLLFDFVFQSNKTVAAKQKNKHKSYHLYLHAFMHGLFSFLIIADIKFLPFAIAIFILHFFTDLFKIHQKDKLRQWFFIDQILHIAVLALCWFFYSKPALNFGVLNQFNTIAVATALVFLTTPSAVIVKVIISKWSPKVSNEQQEDLKSAGKLIGILERLLVFILIVFNQWQAVGFVLTAKSVFRFTDLKTGNRQLTEYVLLGTLISFIIAIVVSIIYLQSTN